MSYFIFLLSLVAYVSSAPVGPVSHVSVTVAPTPAVVAPVAGGGERVGWTSDPAGRGTSKIIMSCGLTLALCIWTAIHPDLVRKTPEADGNVGDADPGRSRPSSTAAAGSLEGLQIATQGEKDHAATPSQSPTSSPDDTITEDHKGAGNTTVNSQNVNPTPTAPSGPDSKSHSGTASVYQTTKHKPAATSNRDRFRQKLYISFKALLIPEEVFTDARKQWIRAFQLYRALIAGHYILHHLNEEPQAVDGQNLNESFKCCGGKRNPLRENSLRMKFTKWLYRTRTPSSPEGSENIETRYHGLLELFFLPSEWELFGKEVTFFVVQGGFVREDGSTISTSDIYSAFMTDPENVCNQIKVEDIRDKGNANVLTKLIVSFQCGWYVVNLILRLITGLPIAFLELHVMIHIITTLAIYMFWWNKQLDVSEPIILKIPEFKYHPTWAQVPITAVQPSADPWKLPLNTVWAVPPEKNKSHWEDAIKQLRELGEELREQAPSSREPAYDLSMSNAGIFERILSDFRAYWKRRKETAAGGGSGSDSKKNDQKKKKKTKKKISSKIKGWAEYWVKNCAFYFAYAGLHATVWRSTFPTTREQLIWRISCLTIAITPFLIALASQILKKLKISADEGKMFMGCVLFILYLGGAGTLLIESFLSLRNQPKEVYQTVDLSLYVPHL